VQPGRPQAWILRERVAEERQVRIERGRAAAAAARQDAGPIDGRGHGFMMDAEVRGDGADLPVLGVVEAPDLGALCGGDHTVPQWTRDGSASAVEGATCSRGHRPYSAPPPPGGRSAPSACPRTVWRGACGPGKSDPSRARGTRADDRDDRAALPGWPGGGAAPPARSPAVTPPDSRRNNMPGRDRRRGRGRTGGCSGGRLSGEAQCPRRRSRGALRLDTTVKPWDNREDRLGPSEHRGGHRGPGGISSRPSPQSTAADQRSSNPVDRGGGARRHPTRDRWTLTPPPPSACTALHRALDPRDASSQGGYRAAEISPVLRAFRGSLTTRRTATGM
jgi:hypothetical protein